MAVSDNNDTISNAFRDEWDEGYVLKDPGVDVLYIEPNRDIAHASRHCPIIDERHRAKVQEYPRGTPSFDWLLGSYDPCSFCFPEGDV